MANISDKKGRKCPVDIQLAIFKGENPGGMITLRNSMGASVDIQFTPGELMLLGQTFSKDKRFKAPTAKDDRKVKNDLEESMNELFNSVKGK